MTIFPSKKQNHKMSFQTPSTSKPLSILALLCLVIATYSSSGAPNGNGSGADGAPEPAKNFKGFNWADRRDNFVNGVLYVSGLSVSSTDAEAQTLTAMVMKTWQDVGANTVRLPINLPTVKSSFWSVYKGVIDKATSMGFKVILCPWTTDHSQKVQNTNDFWAMWDIVTKDYGNNSRVYFELMNEVSYSAPIWRSICDDWLSRYVTATTLIPKGRVIIPGCGKHGERNSNQMGQFPEFNECLLAVHLYDPWDLTSTDVTKWYDLAKSEIEPYGDRTIVTEFGQKMTGGADFMAAPSADSTVDYLAGLSKYMREHQMGGTYWVGLRDGDSWSLFNRHGTESMTVTNPSGLKRLQYAWGM